MQLLDALFGKTQRSKFLVATALIGGSVFSFVGGCATPFYSTDNKILLHFPGAARRSDQIPGVLRPWERIKLIEEKGKKGAKAPVEEKDVLLLQISQEFEKSDSPNVRRASVEAIAKISRNYQNPVAENIFRIALEDNELNIAVSAADDARTLYRSAQALRDTLAALEQESGARILRLCGSANRLALRVLRRLLYRCFTDFFRCGRTLCCRCIFHKISKCTFTMSA